MTTTSYCTRCGALVVRDELGTWTSLSEQRVATDGPVRLSEACPVTQEHHRPEADEDYRGFLGGEVAGAAWGYGEDAIREAAPAAPSWFDDKEPVQVGGFLDAVAGAGL